jgi:AbrB family looped-hinge helix DNA binding protein
MNSVVSEKGQVTIPKALRERLGIKAGEVLEFSEEQGRLVAARYGGGIPSIASMACSDSTEVRTSLSTNSGGGRICRDHRR